MLSSAYNSTDSNVHLINATPEPHLLCHTDRSPSSVLVTFAPGQIR